MKNDNEVRAELIAMWKASTLRELAKDLNVSLGYIHDVIKGRRDITEKLAVKLGYRLEITRTVDRKYFPIITQNSANNS